ncbi:Uncharacterised protein [Actinomyces naeslundii]|nr:Uncharacterised protein [Actinomyces naeslundii]
MWMRNEAERSRLPLVRPSRSLLRAPPGARPRRATRGRVSRPGRTGRTLCRAVAVTTVRQARTRIRRRTVTVVTAIGAASSAGRGRRRCLPYCLLVVLQHLDHGCLHGSACLLALLAQLTAQGQGGCPGGAGRDACSSCSGRSVCRMPAGCNLTGELTGLVAARQCGRERERRLADGYRLARSARWCLPPLGQAIAHPVGECPADCAYHRQADEGQDPDYDHHDETSEDEEEKKRKKRREEMRRRKEGTRQGAHYELATFRYRPRCTETHQEAPVLSVEQSALLPSGSSEPLPRHQSRMGSRSGSATHCSARPPTAARCAAQPPAHTP